MTHGGKREGAGRKVSTGTKPVRAFRLSDEEYEKVKAYVKTLRGE